jgi:hypothetical protein
VEGCGWGCAGVSGGEGGVCEVEVGEESKKYSLQSSRRTQSSEEGDSDGRGAHRGANQAATEGSQATAKRA